MQPQINVSLFLRLTIDLLYRAGLPMRNINPLEYAPHGIETKKTHHIS